jgi:hypothetical protein
LEIFDYLGGDDVGVREIGAVFEAFVFKPKDVEIEFVALGERVVIVRTPATLRIVFRPRWFSVLAILWIVGSDEVVEVAALQWVFLEREMFVGAQIVDPELLCPGFLRGGFAVEEEDVGLDALGVEDAGGQTQQGVNIGLPEQFASDRLPSPRLCEFVALCFGLRFHAGIHPRRLRIAHCREQRSRRDRAASGS